MYLYASVGGIYPTSSPLTTDTICPSNAMFYESLKTDYGFLNVWGFSYLFPSNIVPHPAVNHLL